MPEIFEKLSYIKAGVQKEYHIEYNFDSFKSEITKNTCIQNPLNLFAAINIYFINSESLLWNAVSEYLSFCSKEVQGFVLMTIE